MQSGQKSAVRLVLDTNVVASGLLWDGPTARLLELAARGPLHVELVCSAELLAELSDVVGRRKFSKRLALKSCRPSDVVIEYASRTTLVTPEAIRPTVIEDPDDDLVLATALAGQAHLIVTGDAHLLKLGRYRYVPIVCTAVAIAMLGAAPLRRARRASPPKGGTPRPLL